jgi:DMSO/TMAO reductase YedYZ molybdopterin-dependent catalytic subunit
MTGDVMAGPISRGFSGRRRSSAAVPPGQYVTEDFPVLSAGPTPRRDLERWRFTVTSEAGERREWTWRQFRALPTQTVSVDIHCVTGWSKLGTRWEGVPVDVLLDGVPTVADFALVSAAGGYTTNLPLEDLRGGKAWVAFAFDGEDLAPEHGGPARLLVPHLYFWKSAKWVTGIQLRDEDAPGFWESVGYHNYGDPWREQRYWTD